MPTRQLVGPSSPTVCTAVERACPVGAEHFESSYAPRTSYERSHEGQLLPPVRRQPVGNPLQVNTQLLREADLPPCVKMQTSIGDFLWIKTPYHPDARWRSLGGYWYRDKKIWRLPVAATRNAICEAQRLFGTGTEFRARQEAFRREMAEAALPPFAHLTINSEGQLSLKADYNKKAHWKTFGGRWDGKTWNFPMEERDSVIEELKQLYTSDFKSLDPFGCSADSCNCQGGQRWEPCECRGVGTAWHRH